MLPDSQITRGCILDKRNILGPYTFITKTEWGPQRIPNGSHNSPYGKLEETLILHYHIYLTSWKPSVGQVLH